MCFYIKKKYVMYVDIVNMTFVWTCIIKIMIHLMKLHKGVITLEGFNHGRKVDSES
jgi:hypothetical protein